MKKSIIYSALISIVTITACGSPNSEKTEQDHTYQDSINQENDPMYQDSINQDTTRVDDKDSIATVPRGTIPPTPAS